MAIPVTSCGRTGFCPSALRRNSGWLRAVIMPVPVTGWGLSRLHGLPVWVPGIGPDARRMGRGRAFADAGQGRPWRYAYLLQGDVAAYGAALTEWLARHQPAFGRRVPRAVFGDYLAAHAQALRAKMHDRGVQVPLIDGLANDVARNDLGFRLTLSRGEAIHANRVDVATCGAAAQRSGADAQS